MADKTTTYLVARQQTAKISQEELNEFFDREGFDGDYENFEVEEYAEYMREYVPVESDDWEVV